MQRNLDVVLDLDPHQPLQLEPPIPPEEPIRPPEQEPFIQPEMAGHGGDEDISMEEFLAREEVTYSSSIRLPDITARNFEVKPVMIQMLQLMGTFNGTKIEDPVEHLTKFIQMCGNFKHQGVSADALRLRLFPMSLGGKAHAWLNSLPANSITNWDTLANKFKTRFLPTDLRAIQRGELLTFKQEPGETFYDAWERFKELWRNCPSHGQHLFVLLEAFQKGLNQSTQTMLHTAARGEITKLRASELQELYENLAANTMQYRGSPSENSAISAQLDALTKRFEKFETKIDHHLPKGVHALQSSIQSCDNCGEDHPTQDCHYTMESLNYMNNSNRGPQGNPYSNTYNQGWRNHPNMSWKNGPSLNPPQASSSSYRPPAPPGFVAPQQKPLEESKIEKLLSQILANQEATNTKTSLHDTAIKNIEVHMGQLASQVNTLMRQGLPSDTVPNPKREGREECQAITLRSGQIVDNSPLPTKKPQVTQDPKVVEVDMDEQINEDIAVETDDTKKRKVADESLDEVVNHPKETKAKGEEKKQKTTSFSITPPLPYPQRFKKKEEDSQFKKFVEMFKQLHVNIPFAEALENMPKYAKFLKDVLSKKRRFNEFETVALTEECSVVIQRKLPTS